MLISNKYFVKFVLVNPGTYKWFPTTQTYKGGRGLSPLEFHHFLSNFNKIYIVESINPFWKYVK